MFMVDHARDVGLCPDDTEEQITARLEQEVNGESEASAATRAYYILFTETTGTNRASSYLLL